MSGVTFGKVGEVVGDKGHFATYRQWLKPLSE